MGSHAKGSVFAGYSSIVDPMIFGFGQYPGHIIRRPERICLFCAEILVLNRNVSVWGIEEFCPWFLSFLIDQLHEFDRRTVFIDMLNRLFEVFQTKVVTPLRHGFF